MKKQDNSEADKQAESLDDLPLTTEQADLTKAGTAAGTFTLTFNGQTTAPR
jgi:hypothetical protein